MSVESVEDLYNKLVDGISKQDVKIYVKTDLGKEVLVYDSGSPVEDNPESKSFIKYGIKIKNQNDKELFSYGDYPETNYLKLGGVAFVVAVGLFVTLKGLKGIVK